MQRHDPLKGMKDSNLRRHKTVTNMTKEAVQFYPFDTLKTHERLQPRGGVNEATIQRYVNDMRKGDEFPPIGLARVGPNLYVYDGHHRLEAAHALGRNGINATVTRMTLDEAHRAAIAANLKHGRQMTNREKDHAFAAYIEYGLHLDKAGEVKSCRQIASECGVYSFSHVSRKLKAMGIDAPRDDVKPFNRHHRGNGDDEFDLALLTSEDDEITASTFYRQLQDLKVTCALLSRDDRKKAAEALRNIADQFTLEI